MPTTFGKYTIEKKLGQGGMGAVYLAVDPALNRKVAIKIITSKDEKLLERFQLESSAVARLKHPNIVQVYEVGVVSLPSAAGGSARKQHYFTMDYIEGIPLDKLIRGKPKPSFQNIARIIQQVASALHYAHSQKLVHRDIKPANILIDNSGNAYLTDFGVAKQLSGLDRHLTMTGATVGTPSYMPPEQAMGEKGAIDQRSDIFSLGATLYHCLTGRLPFTGKEVYDVLNKVINEDPPLPSSIIRSIPEDLETICLKCLAKDKAKRYQTALELGQDIDSYLRGGQIDAQRTSPISKVLLKVKKNKTASLGIAGAILILIIGLIISSTVSSFRTTSKLEEYRREANYYFNKSEYEKALASCEKALAILPEEPEMEGLKKKCLTLLEEKKKNDKDAAEKSKTALEQARIITAKNQALMEETEKRVKESAEKSKAIIEQAELRARAKTILDRASGASTPDQRIKIAQEALAIDPTFGDAYQIIGYAYKAKAAESGRSPDAYRELIDKAYEYFTKAIEATPTLAYSYYERAMITAYTYNKLEDAISDFNKVLELDPNSDIGWLAKGTVEYHQKNYDKAIISYNKAIELNPNLADAYSSRGSIYYDKGETDRAIRDYNKAIELNPNLATAYSNRGNAYGKKGEADKAMADYTKAIELNPNLAEAYSNRGNVYNNKGEADRAIKDFNKAIELDPNLATVYNNRGNAYNNKGDIEQALKDYNKAIELNPNLASPYANRGNIYNGKGEADRAIKDFSKAIELDPNLVEAYNNRGVTYNSKGEADKAIKDFNKAIELDPNHADAYLGLGVAYKKKGEIDRAIKDYSKAIELNPNLAMAYSNRGNAYDNKGDTEQALKDYNKAIELNPKHATAYSNRGVAYGKKGELDRAIKDFNKSIELDPNFADTYKNRGYAYSLKKDYKKAIADGEQFLKLAPNHPGAAQMKQLIEEWKKLLK
ncbi:MAG: tetratricopeptide repeat protein [Planctomycetota bacterium]